MSHPFCTVTASSKRNPAPVNGRVTAPVAYLTSIAVTPLWALRPETIQVLGIASPREYKVCYAAPDGAGVALPDVKEGDVLVHGGAEYIVDSVAEWPDIAGGATSCLEIVVMAIKGT